MAGEPIEGQVLLLAAAKAGVGPARLADLVDVAQSELGDEVGLYRRRYERVHADVDREGFLADADHWERVGERVDLATREVDALRRAHAEQLLRIGRRAGREDEFASALEIRDPVVVGV